MLAALGCVVPIGGCYESESPQGHTDSATDLAAEEVVSGVCGNGVVEGSEECDDGDDNDCNGCSSLCASRRALAFEHELPGASVPLDASPCLSCPFTVEAWFRIDAAGAVVPIVHQRGFIEFSISVNGYSYNTHMGGAGLEDFGVRLEPGTWHHAALVCFMDDTEGWMTTAFIDGHALLAVGGMGPSSWSCDQPLLIAHTDGMSITANPVGTIDDLRLSRASLYDFDAGVFTPERYLGLRSDTVAFWDFDNVIDDLIPDLTGNGHDAVLVNGLLVPDDCHLP